MFQRKYPDKRISVLIDRAFASLKKEIEVRYGKKAAVFAKLLGWELDCMKQWDQITEWTFYRRNKIIIHHSQDQIIPPDARLLAAMEDKPNKFYLFCLHKEISPEQEVYAHNRLYNEFEDRVIIVYIQYILNISSMR